MECGSVDVRSALQCSAVIVRCVVQCVQCALWCGWSVVQLLPLRIPAGVEGIDVNLLCLVGDKDVLHNAIVFTVAVFKNVHYDCCLWKTKEFLGIRMEHQHLAHPAVDRDAALIKATEWCIDPLQHKVGATS